MHVYTSVMNCLSMLVSMNVRMGTKQSVTVEFLYTYGTIDELIHVHNASKRDRKMFSTYNIQDDHYNVSKINNSHPLFHENGSMDPLSSSSSNANDQEAPLSNGKDIDVDISMTSTNNNANPVESLNRYLVQKVKMLEIE